MKKYFKSPIYLLLWVMFVSGCKKQKTSSLSYIDPNIGGVGHLLQPTRPTVQLPNQMVRMYPVRKDYLDDQISWYPMSIISHRQGELFGIKPINGQPDDESWYHRLTYDRDLEKVKPWRYTAWLEEDEIKVEYTPAARAGMYRFTFSDGNYSLLFQTLHSGKIEVSANNVIEGEEHFHGMEAFFYGIFDEEAHLGSGGEALDNTPGELGRAWYSAKAAPHNSVIFRYGFSWISIDQAKANLEAEIKDISFDDQALLGKQAWQKAIGCIQVQGGTIAQRRTFYTAFYRTYERMINMNEGGRYFSAYDHQVHKTDRDFYTDDWVWDTYLAHHPLRAILHPAQEADMMQSYVLMYQQSGWMPQFPLSFGDNPAMNGFHSSIVFLDDWRKGIRDFDHESAYAGMRKNATSATMLPWRNGVACSLDTFYYQHGYFPALHPDEEETVPQVHAFEKRQSVAVTLGRSYDDWALAQMAMELGKEKDYRFFLPMSKNYKNVYRPDKALMWPKDADGAWIDIDPKFDGGMGGRDYYDENNAYTYAWQVQQDVPGLIGLMGGKHQFEQQLDRLFREPLGRSKYQFWAKFPDATGLVGQYSMGNEPSFHIPYLYNFTSSPWKTQKHIRMLLDTWYPDNIFGIPGDEDGGGMTAFVVFSMMGFYPVTPGLPWYTLGSPVFEKVSIDLPNGKHFTLIAEHASPVNKYIQSAKIDEKSMKNPWFSHQDLVNGATIKLVMGPKPNKALWKDADVSDLYRNE